ncbi:hypothetical protein D9615_010412 [Tricholomella constricta]|uniref:Aminoglycoside phosphotransferase domain-containing protein n=1 Tax=Tricholomella constricta TaxID=117010 RepID=A0A8H5GP95_9AGAR|nr:hypothetical protein D9615_010412 [Tricholomella constricta]
MAQIKIVIDAENKPANLPDPEVIIEQCHGPAHTKINFRGVRLLLDNEEYYWVKFGPDITMGEARTQDYVARVLERNADTTVKVPSVYLAFQEGSFGYIVMEYIRGEMCGRADADLVAASVQSLIAIESPDSVLGPVGGGFIQHPFFVDWVASRQYKSVQQLEKHINGILRATERRGRVRLQPEVANYGLRLCPADIHMTNFIKDDEGRIVALDFGATCFLPPSFFAFVMYRRDTLLAQLIANKVKYPKSKDVDAMSMASYALVPYGTNEVGVPRELKSRKN